ncbi:C40 family peptidase [Actinomadura xylanilytica]|uniref:C40 family peptidase n=1 Tax=Actinomadura xylanilytica TaxID=887459 RepID=UPI00255A978F|nr:C40 family peptidase [Actinomadura xylanilytica]MDL4772227.1 C40 family peptidase [Actinomadura xylanilytica]
MATAATVIAVVLGTAAPVTAHAAQPAAPQAAAPQAAPAPAPSPAGKPSEGELRKRLNALNTEAEKLTEKFNKTRVELGKATKAAQATAKTAAGLEAQAAPARQRLGSLAAASYMNGGADPMFGAGGGGDDSSGLTDTAYLAQSRAASVAGLQGQIDRANKAAKAAAAQAAQVERATAEAKTARQAAKTKVGQVLKQLDKLTTTHIKDPKTGLSATVKGSGLPAKMTRVALTKLGSPYVWAAAGPTTFDCSGLVIWAYGKVGKPGLPHYTGDLFGMGQKVDRGSMRSGDLVYFGSDLHHMGIYLGGGKYLHAPQTGDVVKISNLSDRSDFAGANRIS